ncbi:DUF3524 domain-containing protein [Exilibacterium tricleocarpae]|uniref:tRNA-queuosine alpha-mannosyltransferase n=1 Tax=Exilibacterium tricleocarpae TaxID=2591008 RepID=A0A545U3P6_9GAMM|nr:DUF3524 domain-containing protein [Exilibacterium tricleocarpae]TQV84107.1 DUF3524 domain-containing protein [Exilibacterium tricleocarpae]
MRALLLSAYDADSHRRWWRGLVSQFPAIDWTVLTLPARHFRWRIRGNSLSWGRSGAPQLRDDYDLLVATSMVDLAALRGFVPALAALPTLVYFHENQFAYPLSQRQLDSAGPKIVNLYTALCGDVIAFNSDFNRRTFLEGAAALLAKMPDAVPPALAQRLRDRSRVLPVPLEDDCFVQRDPLSSRPLTLLWNHRWEYDKGPDRLLRALQLFVDCDLPFRLHVVGRQFRRRPAQFEQIKTLLQACDALGAWGYRDTVEDYRKLLRTSDIAVSTALHDFQGLAVLEAVAAGCYPAVPRRQAYPEWFGADRCYAAPGDSEVEARALAAMLQDLALQKAGGRLPQVNIEALSWSACRDAYAEVFAGLIDAAPDKLWQ